MTFNWNKAFIAGLMSIASVVLMLVIGMPWGILLFVFMQSVFWIAIYRYEHTRKQKLEKLK